jgi:hypothetical protein
LATTYHPATFQERGMAVPFTTPLLGGTRVRAGREQGIELLVRNPTGGRGVYVMTWAGIGSLCRPTLHDKVLSTRIASLESVTPTTIRGVASAIAAEGLAGEQALQAAQIATKADTADRRATRHRLLVALVHQVNAALHQSSVASGTNTSDINARAQLTIAWLAPHLHQSPAWVVGALDALSDLLVDLGVATKADVGRVARLISMLRQVREDIPAWSKTQRSVERASCADMIRSMADVILSLAGTALANARALTGDMIGLLRTWATDPDALIRIATRPEWLLDGWEQLCLIWNYAQDDATKSAALVEILEHVPILPVEVTERDGTLLDVNNTLLRQRPITLNEDWRAGAVVFDLIARNEQLRGVAP